MIKLRWGGEWRATKVVDNDAGGFSEHFAGAPIRFIAQLRHENFWQLNYVGVANRRCLVPTTSYVFLQVSCRKFDVCGSLYAWSVTAGDQRVQVRSSRDSWTRLKKGYEYNSSEACGRLTLSNWFMSHSRTGQRQNTENVGSSISEK